MASANDRYYLPISDSRFRMPHGPYSLDDIKKIVAQCHYPVKVFDEEGFLKGTMYPNGEFQT